MINFYDILGIGRDADISEIKGAYRKLSKKFHPDLNPNDSYFERMFLRIQEAYEILSNDEKREVYNHLLDQEFNQTVVNIPQASAKPEILNFSVDKMLIQEGEVFTVTWEVKNANSVEIKPFGSFKPEGIEHFKFNHLKTETLNIILIARDQETGASVRDNLTLENASYHYSWWREIWVNQSKSILIMRIIILIMIIAFLLAIIFIGIEVNEPEIPKISIEKPKSY
ncbi:MAG: J domain-containing protein [Weeksellaceae bacterium]